MPEFPFDLLGKAVCVAGLVCLLVTGLFKAEAWVIKRWGGRIGALLVRTGRNVRREHVSLLRYAAQLLADSTNVNFQKQEAANAKNEAGNDGNPRCPLKQSVHNVIPFRKSAKRTPE